MQKKEEEFFYQIKGNKIFFEKETKEYHKTLATKLYKYILNITLWDILTVPFIWICIIPAVFLDLFVSIYQLICFKVYDIPKVKRNEYIVIDHQSLAYLNIIEKLNCVYCGYFNGLIAYIQEIGARTEQYWCPIKHARKLKSIHSRYQKFFEFGDGQEYKKKFEAMRKDYSDLRSGK
uniref:Uncharacterized protein n=1 Tax=uncultured Desulfobacterium sp. TaxID=201089 RepID=E1YMJ4_9BACT|nr:hypothetical protein N47_N26130 [uncultured Desulfobacterium sp.]